MSYAKGMRAMSAGALDVYAGGMVRMRWNDKVTRRSRIRYGGATYAILGEAFRCFFSSPGFSRGWAAM